MVSEQSRAASRSLRRVFTVAQLLLLTAAFAWAQLSLQSFEPLQIDLAGQRVVDGWGLEPEAGKVQTWQVDVVGWRQVYHRWATGGGWKMRQEIAVRNDRLEFTQLRLFQTGETGVSTAGALIPLDTFDGAHFECVGSPIGAAERHDRTWTGTLGPDTVRRINNIEYLRVYLPGGGVDFDTNPKGAWYPGPGLGPAVRRFTLLRYDDGWRLWSADGKARRGAIHDFKLVITPAFDMPVGDVHPPVNTRWTEPYQPTSRLNIGVENVERFEECIQPDGELTRDERFVDLSPERVEGVSVAEATLALHIPVKRDGIYLVSLLAGDPTRALEGCALSADFGEPREMPTVSAGDYACWVLPARAVDGAVTIMLAGDARICAMQAAPMMFDNEDYLVGRAWWVSSDFHEDDDLPR